MLLVVFLYRERGKGRDRGREKGREWSNIGVTKFLLQGTYFTPWVVYNQKTKMFVAWFNAYLGILYIF
jgi:hypothetical protein